VGWLHWRRAIVRGVALVVAIGFLTIAVVSAGMHGRRASKPPPTAVERLEAERPSTASPGIKWEPPSFSIDDPLFKAYRFERSDTFFPGTKFSAWAFGNLDCGSTYSTFMRRPGEGAEQAAESSRCGVPKPSTAVPSTTTGESKSRDPEVFFPATKSTGGAGLYLKGEIE
jgi:hypothetical protein